VRWQTAAEILSENYTKTTLPGIKNVLRYTDGNGTFYADAIILEDETAVDHIYHPFFPEQKSSVARRHGEPLLHLVMENGKLVNGLPTLKETVAYARERLSHLSPEHLRFEFPHVYKVGITARLLALRSQMMEQIQQSIAREEAK